jgi:uncharacterized membrane protein
VVVLGGGRHAQLVRARAHRLRGAPPIEAMKASFRACMRNWLPFLVYGAIGIAIALPAMIVIGVVAGFLGLSVSFGNVEA